MQPSADVVGAAGPGRPTAAAPDVAVATTRPDPGGTAAPRGARPDRRGRLVDAAAVAGLMAALPAVHRIPPLLRNPFWLDESWVAMSLRAGWAQAVRLTGPTPVGWTLLMRLVPGRGPEHYRLLGIGFIALSVLAGYALGRQLGWSRRGEAVLAGLCAAAGALLLPAQIVRHDLKQFTADAAMSVMLLALAAWTESRFSWRRLAVTGTAAVLGMFVSHTTPLVAGPLMVALPLVAALRRDRRALARTMAVAVPTGLAMLATYRLVSERARVPSLRAYWTGYYLDVHAGPGGLAHELARRLHDLGDLFGMPWPAMVALAGAGLLTLVRTHRPVTALTAAAMPVGLVVAGYAHAYPVLDQRTSHFLLVVTAVLGGLGLTGSAVLIGRIVAGHRGRGAVPPAGRYATAGTVTAAVLVGALLVGYCVANAAWIGYTAPPGRYPRTPVSFAAPVVWDVRSQVDYVSAHRRPGDVVVYSALSDFGFAYYWRADRPHWVRSDFGNGWAATYDPATTRIVGVGGRDPRRIADALRFAERMARGYGPGTRVWIIRTYLVPAEAAAWGQVLAGRAVRYLPVGPEPLLVEEPA